MKLPKRKPNRLKNYDYGQPGVYFVTVCTKNRDELFGTIPPDITAVGAASCRPLASCRPHPPKTHLSKIGEIVESEISQLSHTYGNVAVDCHVVMPNHVHMIIVIRDEGGRQDAAPTVHYNGVAPTVSRMINQWKRAVSIKAGFSPWQKSFHDHIIRNRSDYRQIAEYIENNPANWESDRFYENSSDVIVVGAASCRPHPSPCRARSCARRF